MFYRYNCKKKLEDELPKESKITNLSSLAPPSTSTSRTSSTLVSNRSLNNTNSSEFIYIDCFYHNTDNEAFNVVSFDASRNVPILTERSDYKLGVISINGYIVVPLLVRYDRIQMSVSYFSPSDNAMHLSPVAQSDVLGDIYDIWEFVSQFNLTCQQLWVNYQVAYDALNGPGSWAGNPNIPHNPPGIQFDPTNQIFTIYADVLMNALLPNVTILNLDIITAKLLQGVDSYDDFNQPFEEIRFLRGFGNLNVVTIDGNDYIANRQDFSTVGTWHKTNSLVIISDTLGARKVEVSVSSDIALNSQNIVLNIIDTFPISLHGAYNRAILYANPAINYNDIVTTGELNRLTFTLYILNRFGELVPLLAPPNGSVVVKFVFAKTLFTSN